MWLYNCGIFLYSCVIHTASLFNHKAKLWVRGRRDIFGHIEKVLRERNIAGQKVIWFHCASLGEFEQGRPVLEKLKGKGYTIILTFFSPSGYEIRKDYENADAVFYLPIDTPANARRFINLVKPEAALFVKYEFWLNYLAELREQQIPAFLVSGVFRKSQHFFKWYGRNFFKAIKGFKVLFVQDQNSFDLLKQHGLSNMQVAGDTRFDRVMEIVRNKKSFESVQQFCASEKTIVAGSTWPKDEVLLLNVHRDLKEKGNRVKLIMVPHEIDEASMNGTISRLQRSGLTFARFTQGNYKNAEILVIDTIGMLSQIYQYASVAYVGGGFDNGIHNILEVMAHGVPVAFGPNYRKFVEAHEAENNHLGKPVYNEAELFGYFSMILSDPQKRAELSAKINTWMHSKTGATEKVVNALQA